MYRWPRRNMPASCSINGRKHLVLETISLWVSAVAHRLLDIRSKRRTAHNISLEATRTLSMSVSVGWFHPDKKIMSMLLPWLPDSALSRCGSSAKRRKARGNRYRYRFTCSAMVGELQHPPARSCCKILHRCQNKLLT